MSKGLCVCTAVAGNYLAFARVLADSFRRHHPDIPFYLLLPDPPAPGFPAHLLTLKDIAIPQRQSLLLRYNRKQVLVAAKPALLRHLLDAGYDTVLFLDPDTLVTASLSPLFETVRQHSLTLTPHLPPAFAKAERPSLERSLLYAGMYNGGVIGVTSHAESRRFLAWWEARLQTHCLEALPRGIHYDQRWLDLAPSFVADCHLLRDPGVNLAYWNLPDFELSSPATGLHVDGVPLRLFHFSGYRPEDPGRVTCHRSDLHVDDMGLAAGLFRSYSKMLLDAGWAETNQKPWPWDGWRKLVRRLLARIP